MLVAILGKIGVDQKEIEGMESGRNGKLIVYRWTGARMGGGVTRYMCWCG
jgi:hypothetical protein